MGNIVVKHTLPHRIRLKVPALKHNGAVARQLEQCATDVDGIHWVRANTFCAGLVVRFDASKYSENDIVELFMSRTARGNA